jgi:hypothetical protein
MAEMQKIFEGICVARLLDQLDEHPELWDKHNMRTSLYPDSPHRNAHDIWLRFNAFENFDPANPQAFLDEHEPVWYPAIEDLPEAKKIIEEIALICGIEEIGGVLITKIPAGKSIFPHADSGWNCHYFLEKYLLLLQSAPGQHFCYKDEIHEGEAGDLFIFDNRTVHWVENWADVDRISLIISGRHESHNIKEPNE